MPIPACMLLGDRLVQLRQKMEPAVAVPGAILVLAWQGG